MLRRMPLTVAAVAVAVVVSGAAPAHAVDPDSRIHLEWREVFGPDGSITRRYVPARAPEAPAPASALAAADVVPIEVNGPSASRFDFVFVGDGYTSDQLGLYAQHVRSKFEAIMSVEPFRSRRKQFNAWQVNVVSPESGVDNDTARRVLRNTALDMRFWCDDIERLLCVNNTKANQYAAAAGAVDQVIALANTTKYGGAGGGVATASGGNARSGQIVVHELGHSIGHLADEYDYGGGDCYRGGEPRESNVSVFTADRLARDHLKWYRWLGQASPDGGTVGTYTGAKYFKTCIFRPTENSIMRTLGREFNLPGREAMIAAFDRATGMVEAAAPPGASRLWVRPVSDRFRVVWRVDGRPVPAGTTLDVAGLRLAGGPHTVTATVTDQDPAVRYEPLRDSAMTRTVIWQVRAPA